MQRVVKCTDTLTSCPEIQNEHIQSSRVIEAEGAAGPGQTEQKMQVSQLELL